MRAILLGLGFVVTIVATDVQSASAASSPRPWCIRGGANGPGISDCSYVSFQQCRASAEGNGGACIQNPFYRGAQQEPRRSTRERRY